MLSLSNDTLAVVDAGAPGAGSTVRFFDAAQGRPIGEPFSHSLDVKEIALSQASEEGKEGGREEGRREPGPCLLSLLPLLFDKAGGGAAVTRPWLLLTLPLLLTLRPRPHDLLPHALEALVMGR
jgi:hypothetical protein